MRIPICDTHQHLIYPNGRTYSWTKGLPHLEGEAFRVEDYLREIEGTGICWSIFMETTPDEWHEEAELIYSLATLPGTIISGIVANCHPEEDGFEGYLDSILNNKLVGLRRICHIEHDEFSQQPRFVENVRCIGEKGLTFDLCFLARQLPIALKLAQECPDVQFILDHCGIPDIASGALDPWRDNMRKLATLPNVACKISGVLAYCRPDNVTADAVRPYVEHCIECFEWNRVVWGSDWPVCTLATTLRQWVEVSREIVRTASEIDQHKLFHENAARIYGLDKIK